MFTVKQKFADGVTIKCTVEEKEQVEELRECLNSISGVIPIYRPGAKLVALVVKEEH